MTGYAAFLLMTDFITPIFNLSFCFSIFSSLELKILGELIGLTGLYLYIVLSLSKVQQFVHEIGTDKPFLVFDNL